MLGAYAGDKMFRTANQPTPLNTEHDWNKGACVMPLSDCEYTYNIIKSVSENYQKLLYFEWSQTWHLQ